MGLGCCYSVSALSVLYVTLASTTSLHNFASSEFEILFCSTKKRDSSAGELFFAEQNRMRFQILTLHMHIVSATYNTKHVALS